jgi:hypothetical protein
MKNLFFNVNAIIWIGRFFYEKGIVIMMWDFAIGWW